MINLFSFLKRKKVEPVKVSRKDEIMEQLKKAIKKYNPKYYFGYIDINDNYNLISEF